MATTIIKSRDSDNQAIVNSDGRLLVSGDGGGGGAIDIRDTNGNPLLATGGALNVTLVQNPGSPISEYNEVTGVAINATQAVVTYTVPPGQILMLSRIDLSSDQVATVTIDFDGTTNMKKRVYYTNYNVSFDYKMSLPAGTVVTVNAKNVSLDGVASFNATLQGILST